MPLQKLRMKQKPNYLKGNFIKTNEEIKANLKKKISNYQDILKRNFYKKSQSDNDQRPDSANSHNRMRSSNDRNSREGSTKEMPLKYTATTSSGTLSNSMLKKVDTDKRNRFGNLKNVAYDRIGSKSPATRRKEGQKKHNIPRHTPKVFEVDRPTIETEKGYKKRLTQKNEYYDGRRSNVNGSSSSDSSISLDVNKRALNIRRTIANTQMSRDSSLSSSPSRENNSSREKYYNLYSNDQNTSKNYLQMEYEDKQFFKTKSDSSGDIFDKYNAVKASKKGKICQCNPIGQRW